MSRKLKIPRAPKVDNPVMFDAAIGSIQDQLVSDLDWLDYAFGQVQVLQQQKGLNLEVYPGWHRGKGEYENLLPNEQIGNYSFALIGDPQTTTVISPGVYELLAPVSFIFWFDLKSVFGKKVQDRNIEAVKVDILDALTSPMIIDHQHTGSLRLVDIETTPDNVFAEFTPSEVIRQQFMQPYCCFRFNTNIKVEKLCI